MGEMSGFSGSPTQIQQLQMLAESIFNRTLVDMSSVQVANYTTNLNNIDQLNQALNLLQSAWNELKNATTTTSKNNFEKLNLFS
jgi:flagellin-specific chaperone FliS